MNKRHKIEKIIDVLHLSDEEFRRFLPDFCAWFAVTKQAIEVGAEPINMTWIDDGKAGQIHHISLIDKGTGEEVLVRGSAFEEN